MEDSETSLSAIDVSHLSVRHGKNLTVSDFTAQIRNGRITGLLGPNGAGKTTVLRSIVGLSPVSNGSIEIFGKTYQHLPDPAQTLGIAFEANTFHPSRTASNHLRVLALSAGIETHQIEDVLEYVGLGQAYNTKVGSFSQGMRQRLSIAQALLGRPRVLVLDEPTNGLDPSGLLWLKSFLSGYADLGNTILVSSHALADLTSILDDVIILSKGRILEVNEVDRLLQRFVSCHISALPSSLEKSILRSVHPVFVGSDGNSHFLTFRREDLREVRTLASSEGCTLTIGEASLEHIFLCLTGTSTR